MQVVLSSRSRMDKVVSDIVFDFSVKPRLSSPVGNAILVAGSIYEASKYYDLFRSPVDDFDLLIGVTSVTHNLTMVTNNTDHFNHLKGIVLEDWTK
jgi:predicted nucleic acid-binding protein